MDDVRAWLQKPDNYERGIQLYLLYGDKQRLKNLFTSEGESPFKRTVLIRELQAIANDQEEVNEASQPPRSQPASVHQLSTAKEFSWKTSTDVVLTALYRQWQPLYAEMLSLQHRVYEVALQGQNGDSAKLMEASQMVHRILDLDDEVDEIYRQRDHYVSHGVKPATKNKEPVGDPARWPTMLHNAQRYVREYRLKLSKEPNHKSSAKWAAKLLEYQAAVRHYKLLLKHDPDEK